MSHFTVLVIGEDVEGQLAGYDENMAVEPYRLPIDLAEAKDMAQHYLGIDPTTITAITPALAARLIAHMPAWNGGEGGYDSDGGLYYLSHYNPDSKWDWYAVGGRWTGFFRLKPDGVGILGDSALHPLEQMVSNLLTRVAPADVKILSSDTPAPQPGTADQAQKRSIDWEAMIAEKAASSLAIFRSYEDCFAGKVIPPFKDFLTRATDAHAARAAYWADPVIAAIRSRECERGESLTWTSDYRSFFADGKLDIFVTRQVSGRIATYAVVRDGEWFAPGDMGWFGMSSESDHEQDTWHAQFFDRFIAPLHNDAWLTVVDCHI